MLRRALCLVASFGILMASSAADVQARSPFEYHQGSLCNPKTINDIARIDYSEYGIYNPTSTSAATVNCGVQFKYALNTRFFVYVYDRHPTQDICCTGMAVDLDGNTLNTAQDCTSQAGSAAMTLDVDFVDTGSSLLFLECTIPPRTSNGLSHVTSYVVM